jgi:hypothetical protein
MKNNYKYIGYIVICFVLIFTVFTPRADVEAGKIANAVAKYVEKHPKVVEKHPAIAKVVEKHVTPKAAVAPSAPAAKAKAATPAPSSSAFKLFFSQSYTFNVGGVSIPVVLQLWCNDNCVNHRRDAEGVAKDYATLANLGRTITPPRDCSNSYYILNIGGTASTPGTPSTPENPGTPGTPGGSGGTGGSGGPVVATPGGFTASCILVNPGPFHVYDVITWTVIPSVAGTYTYSWVDSLTGVSGNPASKSFDSLGTKSVSVEVTNSSGISKVVGCSDASVVAKPTVHIPNCSIVRVDARPDNDRVAVNTNTRWEVTNSSGGQLDSSYIRNWTVVEGNGTPISAGSANTLDKIFTTVGLKTVSVSFSSTTPGLTWDCGANSTATTSVVLPGDLNEI